MKKVILALADLYIDFELFDAISLSTSSITLYGEFNYKTAKEVLRLNMELKSKTEKPNTIFETYNFIRKKEHQPDLQIILTKTK